MASSPAVFASSLQASRRSENPASLSAAGRSRSWLARAVWLGLLLVAGCGNDLAQTASLDASGLLDCSAAGAVVLPKSGNFGDGREPASALVGSGYSGGQGPGLFITARDAFRVYLNGELVVVSSAARATTFVPLTLLPGDNALSVVVAAQRGTPAALIELDELDQNYPSDTSWKASTAPAAGYAAPDFDDSSWPAASDLGALGSLPGCGPDASFPSNSRAHWIGAASSSGGVVALRKAVRIAAIGYGAGTTGGQGQPPTMVSTWNELQALATDPSAPAVILLPEGNYDFRTADRDQPACPSTCSSDASKSLYTVLASGQTCANALVTRSRNERTLTLGSNKTIVGLGRGAQLRGLNVDLGSSHNSIVRNVAIYDVNPALVAAGDAFTLTGSSQIWLDHVTIKWISDGFTAVNAGSQKTTFSWLHFDGVNDNACDGSHKSAAVVTDASATFHHCFFDHVESNSPSAHNSSARVHLFDNLLTDNVSYAVEAACNAQVLLEANTFQRIATPTERASCPDDTGLGLIDAPAGSNYYGDDVGPNHGGDGLEPDDTVFTPPYSYPLGVPQDEWPTVQSNAGVGGPWGQLLSLD